jgi:hypothetical protein
VIGKRASFQSYLKAYFNSRRLEFCEMQRDRFARAGGLPGVAEAADHRDGRPQTVRYNLLIPMLLNELQKQYRANQALQTGMKELEARFARLEAQLSTAPRPQAAELNSRPRTITNLTSGVRRRDRLRSVRLRRPEPRRRQNRAEDQSENS